jgi:hypothetical protein
MAEETLILNLEVDQGAAEKQLEKIEGILIDNKKAVTDLQAAYKKGTITQEEYVKENIRLQQNIKKEQDLKKTLIRTIETESNSRNALKARVSQLTKEYDNLNLKSAAGVKRSSELEKELAKLNSQLTKGDKAAGLFKNQIGNYPKQFGDAAKNIKLAGVSVGDMTGKLGAFLNPATAAAGVLAGLVAAYASSVSGAKDLQKATDTLSGGFQIASENYAKFVQELTKSAQGKGPLEQASSAINRLLFGTGVANQADALAAAKEILRQLEISRAFAAGDAKNDERRAELARRRRDDEKKSLEERLAASKEIDEFFKRSGERTAIIIESQIEGIKRSTIAYDLNRDAQLLVAQLTAEIADKEEEITGKLTENVTAREKILQLQREALELATFEAREKNVPKVPIGPVGEDLTGGAGFTQAAGLSDPVIKASKDRQTQFIDELKTVEFTEKQKRLQYEESLRIQIQAEADRERANREAGIAILGASASVANSLSKLAQEGSEEQKALALLGIAFDTASAIAGGVAASQDIPYPGNLAAMASTIAAIVAAIAEANAVISGFAEGGWTGPGAKHDVAGVVHADEYVTPKNVVHMPQAQPHLAALERMRGGYFDGGMVTNMSTAPAQQALIMANALKNLPVPILDVRESTRVAKKISVKESLSTLRP